MSLTANTIQLSGIQTSLKKMELIQHNIANAGTVGYEKLSLVCSPIVLNNQPQGVSISAVQGVAYDFLNHELYHSLATNGKNQILNDFYKDIELFFGTPQDNRSISSRLSEFFTSTEMLSETPNNPAMRYKAVHDATQLVQQIQSTAKNLEELRLKADSMLGNVAATINQHLTSIYNLNQEIRLLEYNTIQYADANCRIKSNLNALSEFFDIKVTYNTDNTVNVDTVNGIGLVHPTILYRAQYKPSLNVEQFIYDDTLNPFYITVFDKDGNDLNVNLVVVDGGKSFERNMITNAGKVPGLIELRDKYIPEIISKLDSFTEALVREINILHNDGSGMPPASVLIGSRDVSVAQDLGFTGSCTFAVVDNNGEQISDLAANIDLGALDTGAGAGHANTYGIIQEINYMLGSRINAYNKVNIGTVSDMKLVARNNLSDGVLNFDLELENISGVDSSIRLVNVTALDQNNNNILSLQNNSSIAIPTGSLMRTKEPYLTISPLNTSTTYNISADVEINDGEKIYTSTVTYSIPSGNGDPINGWHNLRFDAKTATNDGSILRPEGDKATVVAELIDNRGCAIPINDLTTSGKLRLRTVSQCDRAHIAINQNDSKQEVSFNTYEVPTHLGFSAYFGLNDLFVYNSTYHNNGAVINSAISLDIRKDILEDSNLLSTGRLRPARQSNDKLAKPQYKYELSAGDGSIAEDIAQLANKNTIFHGDRNKKDTATLRAYSNDISVFVASRIQYVAEEYESSNYLVTAIADQVAEMVGVDINEQLAELTLWQQIMSASAYSMRVSKDLFETLINSL